MAQGVVLLGHVCTGHGCWPARPNSSASPNVFANGKPKHRVGDSWQIHCCPFPPNCHDGVQATGSPTVFANGKAVARVGDSISCGSTNAEGSSNVFA